MRERYEGLTKAELADHLAERGLSKTGNVDERVERLLTADSNLSVSRCSTTNAGDGSPRLPSPVSRRKVPRFTTVLSADNLTTDAHDDERVHPMVGSERCAMLPSRDRQLSSVNVG